MSPLSRLDMLSDKKQLIIIYYRAKDCKTRAYLHEVYRHRCTRQREGGCQPPSQVTKNMNIKANILKVQQSITMRKINPSHVTETSFTCSFVIN